MWEDLGYTKNQHSGVTGEQILRTADDKTRSCMMGKDSSFYLKEPRAGRTSTREQRILRNKNCDDRLKRADDVINNFSDPLIREEPLLPGKHSRRDERRSYEDFEELEALRNGAINKSLEKGLLHRRKKPDASDETQQANSQMVLRPRQRVPGKYAYHEEKSNAREDNSTSYRKKQIKTINTCVANSTYESHRKKETEVINTCVANSTYQQHKNKPTKVQKQLSRRQLDSLSSFEFQQIKVKSSDRERVTDTTAPVRPKSAGQAMYMRVNCLSSDSDDSSLDGEIEVIDLDDSLQFDDEESAKPVSAFYDDKSHESSNNSDVFILQTEADIAQFSSYHDNGENRRQRNEIHNFEAQSQTGFSVPVKKIDDNDVTDLSTKPSRKLMTSERRGRIQSEPDIERSLERLTFSKSQSVKIKRGSGNRTSYQTLDPQENKPKINHSKVSVGTDITSLKPRIGKDKLYADAFEKVLSKYSKFTIARDGTTQPAPISVPDKRACAGAPRVNLPRKLKPILKREKLGPISQNKSGERDFEIPSH